MLRMIENAINDPSEKQHYSNECAEITKDFSCRFLIWCDSQDDFNEKYQNMKVNEIFDLFEKEQALKTETK